MLAQVKSTIVNKSNLVKGQQVNKSWFN